MKSWEIKGQDMVIIRTRKTVNEYTIIVYIVRCSNVE